MSEELVEEGILVAAVEVTKSCFGGGEPPPEVRRFAAVVVNVRYLRRLTLAFSGERSESAATRC